MYIVHVLFKFCEYALGFGVGYVYVLFRHCNAFEYVYVFVLPCSCFIETLSYAYNHIRILRV